MNRILFSFCLLLTFSSFAGGFRWPNVQYEYAKLYLINIELEQPNYFDWHIYEDGVYATSKIGSGYEVSEGFLNKLHSNFSRGVNELRMGLGKCYMPRHGIIYHDKNGVPVAAFTACFECDKISFWSTETLPKINYEGVNNDWNKAEKQIEKIKNLFVDEGYPIFNGETEYQEFIKDNEDYKVEGELFITAPKMDEKFASSYSIGDVKEWLKSAKHAVQLRESEEIKITAGGDKYVFKTLIANKGNTKFLFSSEGDDAHLVEAYITHGNILFPTGASIGMSVEDVQGLFAVYDGIAWPKHIQVKGERITVDYYFDNRSLVLIKAIF